jgi:hypothetical protein
MECYTRAQAKKDALPFFAWALSNARCRCLLLSLKERSSPLGTQRVEPLLFFDFTPKDARRAVPLWSDIVE